MTEQELAEIEARAAAATPGPWKPEQFNIALDNEDESEEYGYHPDGPKLLDDGEFSYFTLEDCQFMCMSRTAVPALVAEVRRLRAALADIASAQIEDFDAWAKKHREPSNAIDFFRCLAREALEVPHER